tara:strand:+ start:7127 stop:8743 length:1617 start_codon:yes stop_codon:yes gene_type:complete
MVSVDTPQPGDLFGGVTLIRVLGSGGFGSVWLAADGIGLHVAIKLISKRFDHFSAADREQKAAKLLRESATSHPNIVRMHHIGSTDEFFFYTMDLADPQEQAFPASCDRYLPTTLQSLLASGVPVSPDDAVEIVSSLLSGLSHLHGLKIIHRDMKPANILKVGGVWKIADFGVATNVRTELTTVGTIGYLAPNGKTGVSTDLFALGKILYCLLTGNPVEEFPSVGKLVDSPVDRARRFRLIQVVNKACAQDPMDRYIDSDEFSQDLHRAADTERIYKAKRARAICVLIVLFVSLIGIGYWVSKPKRIGVGESVSTTTIPNPEVEKNGGDLVTFVVTHAKTWEKNSGGNGHRYLAFLRVHEVAEWGLGEAVIIADQLGGQLVSINTAQENAWLFSEIVQDPQLWTSYARAAPEEFLSDSSVKQRELSLELKEYSEEFKDKYEGYDDPNFQLIPAANGPLIGIRMSADGESLEWIDGSSFDYESWAPFQPYYEVGDPRISFGFANLQAEVPISTWARRSYENYKFGDRPNRTISFIVEIQ